MARVTDQKRGGALSWQDLPFWAIWLWPVLTLVLLGLLWGFIVVQVKGNHDRAVREALQHVLSANNAYVQYVERTVRQMDQVTRFVSYQKDEGLTARTLRELVDQILVPVSSPVMLSIADASGRITLTSGDSKSALSVVDRDYFEALSKRVATSPVVATTKVGKITLRPSLQIARRLSNRDGTFAGVVVLSLPPQLLTNFYRTDDLGSSGLLAVAGKDGIYRAMQVGQTFSWGTSNADRRFFSSATGALLQTESEAADHIERFVAWHRLDGYPLIAITGISAAEGLAGFMGVRKLYIRGGLIVSVLLVILGVGATALFYRLENRRRAVLEAKAAYRTASEGTLDAFFVLEPVYGSNGTLRDLKLTDANARGAEMLGRPGDSLINTHLSNVLHGKQFASLLRHYNRAIQRQTSMEAVEVFVSDAGPFKDRWISHRAVPARHGLAVTVRDLTKIKQHEASLVFVANHDAVTRLPNRNWLQTYLPQAIGRAREAREKLGVFFVDLDDFKKVNDTLGHTVGDRLLSEISERLRRMSRDTDVVCHLGGDEFTLVVQGRFARQDMETLGARIVDTLAQPFELDGQTILVGASVGISVFPDSGNDATELLKNADLAMYSAKESGKGLFEFFSPRLSDQVETRVAIERELHAALKNNEFFLVYQPKVDLHTHETCGFEALLRWNSPTRGLVPPLDFIGLAEKTGLILPIGECVIDMACAQLSAWRTQGLTLLPVSVNVSPRQLRRGNLPSQLASTLARYDIPAYLLEIELTESSMMEDPEHSQKQILAIKELGVRVLVDDFGTGYSSLALLKRFEVDVLKVDRSFVSDVPRDPEDCAILSAVVSMARALKMDVVAEGVETIEQREYLASLGCQQGQGYFFSRPVPAKDLVAWFPVSSTVQASTLPF